MFAGELLGPDQATTRFDRLTPSLPEDSPLLEDIAALRAIYGGQRPDATTAQRLKTHHGWIGELAGSHGLSDSDPARVSLLAGGETILFLTALVGVAVFGATIAGIVLLILALVRGAGRRWDSAFIPPSPGGSLAIEMVALFVLGFLALKAASAAAEMWLPARQALWFALVGQWTLLAVCLWPRFRQVPRGMTLMGWHRGKGVAREIGAGLIGYLACIPIMFLGVIVSLTLVFIHAAIRYALTGQPPPPAPENPVLEIASGRSGVLITVMIFFLASLWAPIVEETIFRGCLYRHLRSFWHWLPAGLLTALCFGVMHGYPILMLGPVIALGFGFSLLREWRGSLIAPMTAHFLHNTFVLGLLLVAMRLIDA
jgi:membrane protease YdiL (CAAX protease family)